MNNEYKILVATATRTLELAVMQAMNEGWQPQGAPSGSMGQGYMQAVVREKINAPEQQTSNE